MAKRKTKREVVTENKPALAEKGLVHFGPGDFPAEGIALMYERKQVMRATHIEGKFSFVTPYGVIEAENCYLCEADGAGLFVVSAKELDADWDVV